MIYDDVPEIDFKVPVTLELKPVRIDRGRSAANVIMESEDYPGARFVFGIKGCLKMFLAMSNNEFEMANGYIYGKFIKRKQGQNVRWEPASDS